MATEGSRRRAHHRQKHIEQLAGAAPQRGRTFVSIYPHPPAWKGQQPLLRLLERLLRHGFSCYWDLKLRDRIQTLSEGILSCPFFFKQSVFCSYIHRQTRWLILFIRIWMFPCLGYQQPCDAGRDEKSEQPDVLLQGHLMWRFFNAQEKSAVKGPIHPGSQSSLQRK